MLFFLEKTYFKIILDLLNTLQRFNFIPVNIILKSSDTKKSKSITFNTLSDAQNYYFVNTQNSVNCAFGNNIYLNTLTLNCDLLGQTVSYNVNDASVSVGITKATSTPQNAYYTKVIENQISKIKTLFKTYTNTYAYVLNSSNYGIDDFYSACYAVIGWTNDVLVDDTYRVIYKYNLFDLKSQEISPTDYQTISKIVLY